MARKRHIRFKAKLVAAFVAMCAVLVLTSCDMLDFKSGGSHVSGPPRDTTPVVLAVTQPGIAMIYDDRAILDYSNASEGYICVMSNLPGIRVKVLVDVYASGAQYQYTLDAAGAFVTIPLSEGDGIYSVGVWQNVFDDSYSPVFSYDLNVVLNDQFLPFLYPSQFVDFVYDDAAVNLSQQLAEGSVTDVDAINKIYKWVCQNVKYDIEKATTVASGYLPDNTDTINSGQGICFDYAVLTASMLRAQRVPAKLVIGYAGTTYHAWMLIYSVETGKVVGHSFNGSEWIRMDPTFDAAAGGAVELASVIGDGTNYQPLFYY